MLCIIDQTVLLHLLQQGARIVHLDAGLADRAVRFGRIVLGSVATAHLVLLLLKLELFVLQ